MTELGQVYRDTVSGFVGTATGRAEYLHDTPDVKLVAHTGPTDDEKSRWVSETRLEPHNDDRATGFTS